MKITTDGIVAANQAQNSTQREKTSGRFEEILTDIAKKATTSPDKTSASQPAFQVAPVFLDPINNDDLLQRLDGSLALLESYQSRLGDPAVPIHELQPDVDKLEHEQNSLHSKLMSLSDDHPVKDLLNRSVVTMAVEVAKYRRGDFH
jgi:hypothetical protein